MAALISLDEARSRVCSAADTLVDLESVDLLAATGRRLAQDYHADVPWPATDRAAMDGYGLRAGSDGIPSGSTLRVVGTCLAGHPFTAALGPGEALRIMTGAVVPQTVDAVVPVEATSGYVEVGASVRIDAEVRRGANIRPEGSEVAVGELLLAAGTRIGPAEVGALAVLGIDPVPVFQRPVVAVLATGDEVVGIHAMPAAHQVRNSNAYALAAQVIAAGGEPRMLGIARDEPDELRQAITAALDGADIVLTIGGVSKGTHDLVHAVFAAAGVEERFHGVAIKPGKPVFFGTRLDRPFQGPASLRRKTFVFGLPGNPASAFTVFDLLVAPLIARLSGAAAAPADWYATATAATVAAATATAATAATATVATATVAGEAFRRNPRLQVVPARLRTSPEGQLIAELGSSRPSGDPFGLQRGPAYALIPPDTEPGPGLVVPIVFHAHADAVRGA